MLKKLAGITACALILQAGVALAENRAETFTFAPYVGGYTFESKQNQDTAPVFGFRLGYNFTDNLALEGVIDYLTSKSDRNWGAGGDKNMLRYGGDLVYNFMPKSSFVPYLAAGAGLFNFDGQKARGIYNYGGGVKLFLTDGVALRADVRGLNYSVGEVYTNVQYTLGLHIAVGAPKPAPVPIAAPEPVVEAVAPKAAPVVVVPPAPTSKLSADPASIENGKSSTLSWSSTNTTGCEIQPEVGPVPSSGSKVVTPAANTSYTLTCTGEGGKTTSGASVTVTEPVKEATVEKASPVAAGARLVLKVNFDVNKSVIKKQYYEELKQVGEGLNAHKELKGVIEGYTSNTGSAAYNMKLSQRRANAVRDYIIKNFKVAPNRLSAKGYGEAKPIADNATVEGRAQNRRIEAVFEEIPNFKADQEQPAPVKAVKKVKKAKKATKTKK